MLILSKYVYNQMKLNSIIIPLQRRFSKGAKLLFLNDERPLTFQQHIHAEDGPPDDLVYGRPGVRTVCLYAPENKNALSIDLMNRLIFSIKLDDDDPNLRCIVMWAKGNVFSAGHDLKELTKAAGPEKHKQVFETAEKLMKAIVECPVPVIAKVDGHAAAAGCQLVAQCDLVIASTRSKFSTPGANCGIFCSTPGIALARSISRKHALQMLLTGTPITAEEAYRIGLVNKVVPYAKLDDELDKIVKTITSKSRDVITLGKKFFYEQIDKPLLEAYELGSHKMCENLAHPDATEGVDSFIHKRKPKWQKQLQKVPTDENDPKPPSRGDAGNTTSIIGNLATKKPQPQTSASVIKSSLGGKTKSEKLETITKRSSQPRTSISTTKPASGGKLRSEKSVNLGKKDSSIKEFIPRLSSSERRRVSYSMSTNLSPSTDTIGTPKSLMYSIRDIHSLSELYTNNVSSQTSNNDSMNNRGCDDAVVTEINWSEINEQFDEDKIFDYSDFYFKLDELLDSIKYENRPALNIRKLKDFELNKDELDGILSFRMISTGLSCLDVIPRLHKYVFTRLILRKLNLKNIVTVARHRYLRHINLSYNCLEDVSCLSACPFLIHLDVSHNNLTELLNFSPPYYLTTVIYDNNRITHMPDLSEFWSIVNLSVEQNFIEKMDGLSELRFLKSLNLSGNNIERIEGISNLYIEDLKLSCNQISGFEDDVDDKKYGFKTMPCLTYVNLSNNNLQTLKLFEDSATLRIVNVSYNEVDDLLELGYFTYDVGLISLNMMENPICKFPGYRQLCIQHALNIKYLDGVIVDDKEKVTANCIFSPNLWLCSLNKHAVFNFFKYFNMPTINLSTVPYDRPSTPIIMLVGPEAMKNDLAYEFCKKYPKHTYFIPLYTTRPPVVDRENIFATYHHVNRQTFNSMIKDGEFISVHQFLGHSYGFSHAELVKAIEAKCVAVVTSDITGAFQLRMSGLNPTLIKITSQNPENYRRWLQSVFDTYFWDVLSPKDSAIIIARKNLQLSPDSDHIVRQSRDVYYDFATNVIELENKEVCCECTCDCVKFFRHVEDWEKFIANLHSNWSEDHGQSFSRFIPPEAEMGKATYERSSTPSAKVTSDIIDYLHRITEKKAKMYDELHNSNPGLFADSIYTDHKIEAFEKLKDYVKKKFMEYKENCKEPHIEISKDDAYMNMINRRINQVLEDLNDSENTALAQRKQAFQTDMHEPTVPDQLDPIFKDIVQRYASMPRIQVDRLPEIPIHLNETLHHLLFDE